MSEDLQRQVDAEIAQGSDPRHPVRRSLSRAREWIERHPRLRWAYRFVVAVLGITIALVGLILVPLPGPGWLIVFLGLGILGTEFHAARRINAFAKRQLDRFWTWWRSRRA